MSSRSQLAARRLCGRTDTAMQPFFVNLPLAYIARDRWYLDEFIRRRLAPELGLDAAVMSRADEAWHRDIAAALRSAGLSCAVHLPFFDLQPGSLDDFILEATRRRLDSVKKIIALYQPRHIIAHAGHAPLYTDFPGAWLERAVATWAGFMQGWPGHPVLFLENVYEQDPQPLQDLFAGLSGHNAGMCFDAGHWHSFSRGCQTKNLPDWIAALRQSIRHLHLHDNDGADDRHWGLGRGRIAWEVLFAELAKHALHPGITLEPHTGQDLEHSLDFIEKHPEWFATDG